MSMRSDSRRVHCSKALVWFDRQERHPFACGAQDQAGCRTPKGKNLTPDPSPRPRAKGLSGRAPARVAATIVIWLGVAGLSAGQGKTPKPALLVLNKADS